MMPDDEQIEKAKERVVSFFPEEEMEINKEYKKRPSSDSLVQQSQLHNSDPPTVAFARSMDLNRENKRCASSDSFLQWSQWQLLDSVLPTGGFAHSFGLEAAIQARIVSSPEDLQTFVINLLENTGSLLLPFVYSTTMSPDFETRRKLDKMLDAMLTNEVSRKASISQGSALMRVAASVYSEIPSLKSMREASLSSGVVSFHHAPMFGVICGLLGLDSTTSQRAYMFITMRDVISAATRLNLVGPLGAAVLQHQIASVAEAILNRWKDRSVEEACQTVALLDIVQGYIKDFEVFDPHRVGRITVQLQGRVNNCRALTYRQDLKARDIEGYMFRTLPTRQCGYVVITTPEGVWDHKEAIRRNVGGQVIGYFH